MAKEDTIYEELKLRSREGKLIFGADQTLKNIKKGKIKRVVLASNCPKELEEKIRYYSKIQGFDIIKSEFDREELGKLLGKAFLVAVIGELK
ncbi:MAG TPA: 50S ribosomal protein L30 [Nautiliaceae bacterium]|nr:50S ribosomal protein L30 [Nautiliaceae bacterium]